MKHLTLVRYPEVDDSTPGLLIIQSSPITFQTLERPWIDNSQDISCIPPGKYHITYTYSKRFKTKLYILKDVTNRTGIRIHVGNDVTDNGVDTNWLDEVFDTAFMQRYDFSLSGGTKKTSYYFSAGHTNQEGTVGNNSSFDRTSFRFNLTSEITDWLEIGINSNSAIIRRKGITENSDTRGVIQNALILDP